MLLQRIITALILLPLLLAVVWFAPNTVLYAVLCVIGVLVAWEWAALWGGASPQRRLRYAAASGALLLIAWLLPARAVWLRPWPCCPDSRTTCAAARCRRCSWRCWAGCCCSPPCCRLPSCTPCRRVR
jgi:hypothetical protein